METTTYSNRRTAFLAAVNEVYDTSYKALEIFRHYISPLGELKGETFDLPENENGIRYRLKITEAENGFSAVIKRRTPKWLPRRSKQVSFMNHL